MIVWNPRWILRRAAMQGVLCLVLDACCQINTAEQTCHGPESSFGVVQCCCCALLDP